MERRNFMVAAGLGAAGLVPFLVLGLMVIFEPLTSPQAITAMIGYGAVVLSFLGAVHWGFALRAPAPGEAPMPPRAARTLLVFGVVPALVGWAALLAETLAHLPAFALFILVAGFFLTAIAETIGRGRGIVQANYLVLRWGLSIVALLTMLVVLFAVLTGMRLS